jgi:replication initiation and membrane attachment protein
VGDMAQHWQELIPINRFIVTSDGLLHEYDRKVLTFLYQPLIGSTCFSLYMTLWTQLEENSLWSEPSSHHFLMNLLGLNLKDIYDARLKLEGIGLLKTYVKTEEDNRSFIYELHPPVTPELFFKDGMLNVYLYQMIGRNHFNRLKRFFSVKQKPVEEEYDEVTKSFQDVFGSSVPGNLQKRPDLMNDFEPEENQQFIFRHDSKSIQINGNTFDFELLMAGLNESIFPKRALTKKVKEVISNLAFLYKIDPIEMKKLLLDALDEHDEINIEVLRKSARDWYQLDHYDQLPSLIEGTQPIRYQVQLEEPKTQEEKLIRYFETSSPLQVLKDRSNGGEPSRADLQVIEQLMINQNLPPGVVNVLIDFVLIKTDMKLTRNYVEKIASQWARKQIKTVKEAMEQAKKEHGGTGEFKKPARTTSARKSVRTEIIPDWFNENAETVKQQAETEDSKDVEAKKRAIEEKLKAFRK